MKRFPVLLSLVLITSASLFVVSASAISLDKAANSPGSSCKKLGITAKSGKFSVKCVKSGKKLVWKKVNLVKPPTKPSATPAVSAKPTTSPNPKTTETLPAAQDAYAINVRAVSWSWSFTYARNGIKSPLLSDSSHSRTLFIPLGKSIHFSLNSGDVPHGFWVPGLSIDKVANPDAGIHFEFTADKIGTFPGACNDPTCGRGHSGMTFSVVVVTEMDYLKYLSTLKSS